MDGFRRMLWVGRQHSADHIPVSALQLVTCRWFKAERSKGKEQGHSFLVRRPTRRSRGRGVAPWRVSPWVCARAPLSSGVGLQPVACKCVGAQNHNRIAYIFQNTQVKN